MLLKFPKLSLSLIISHYLSLIKIIKCRSFQGHGDIMWHSVTYREPGSKVIIPSWDLSFQLHGAPRPVQGSSSCFLPFGIFGQIWSDLNYHIMSYSDGRTIQCACFLSCFIMWGFNEWSGLTHFAQVPTAGTVSTGRSVTSVTSIKLPGWPHGTTVSLDAGVCRGTNLKMAWDG